MAADPEEKAARYSRLLAEALEASAVASPEGSPRADAAHEVLEMARAYLDDGDHFRAEGDDVTALAAYSYGHGWLDAGARIGLVAVSDDDRFAI